MKNGQRHLKLCQCQLCVARRFDLFLENLETFESKNGLRPTNPDQTVCVKKYTVRAHFRRNPHHLQGDEGLKKRVHSYFENVTKKPEVRRKGQAQEEAQA